MWLTTLSVKKGMSEEEADKKIQQLQSVNKVESSAVLKEKGISIHYHIASGEKLNTSMWNGTVKEYLVKDGYRDSGAVINEMRTQKKRNFIS